MLLSGGKVRGNGGGRLPDNLNAALGYLQMYGPAVLAVALFLAGIGVPVPAAFLVLAAGAWARQGKFSLPLVFAFALMGAVCGSGTSYWMGRKGLQGVINRLARGNSWQRAEKTFREKGATAIILTRFLLTPLALPTNLIAGGERYPFPRFLLLCAIGEGIWVLLYGGLGYAFAESWQRVGGELKSVGGWAVAGALLLFALYELWKHWRCHLKPCSETADAKG
jgi:membrane-associated protein